MTSPKVDLEAIVPSKAKTLVGLVGSLITFLGPFILQSTDALPAPWPAVIGVVFAVLTALGIYRAPYKPSGTTLALDPSQGDIPADTPGTVPVAVPGSHVPGEMLWTTGAQDPPRNPWKPQA